MLKEQGRQTIVDRSPSFLLTCSLFFLSGINFFRIGFQLVLTAWLSVEMTGQASAVGKIFLITSLTTLVVSPVIGRYVDFIASKKALILCGYAAIVLSGVIPLLGSFIFPADKDFILLAVASIVTVVGATLASSAMDYFIKIYLPVSKRARKLALLNSITQIAVILGSALGGIILTAINFYQVFLIISFLGMVLMGGGYLLPNLVLAHSSVTLQEEKGKPMVFLYCRYPDLFVLACGGALVFSVAQATNAFLPALVNIYLRYTSIHYSMVEVAWSIGAFCTSIVLTRMVGSRSRSIGYDFIAYDLLLIFAMAVLLAVVPYLKAFFLLLIFHCVLGVLFAWLRIRNEAKFLALCPTLLLGRLRASSIIIFNTLGLIVFAIPSLYKDLPIPFFYLLVAGLISLGVLGLSIFINTRFYKLKIRMLEGEIQ